MTRILRFCLNCNSSNVTEIYDREFKSIKIGPFFSHDYKKSKLTGLFCKDCGVTRDFLREAIEGWAKQLKKQRRYKSHD